MMSRLTPNPEKDPGGRALFVHMHSTLFGGVFSKVTAPLSLHCPYTRKLSAPATVRYVPHWIIGATGPRNRCPPNASPAKKASKVFQFLFFSHIEGGREAQRSRMPPPICRMHSERVIHRCASWFYLSSRNKIRDRPRRDLTSRR